MKRAALLLAIAFLGYGSDRSVHRIRVWFRMRNSKPLPGANLVISALNRGTVSSADGTFTLENIPEGTLYPDDYLCGI